jgi:hypothetical protein
MEPVHGINCKRLLLDILFYEKSCSRLSPEMDYLLEQHLAKCPGCRHKILSYQRTLMEATMVRNYG